MTSCIFVTFGGHMQLPWCISHAMSKNNPHSQLYYINPLITVCLSASLCNVFFSLSRSQEVGFYPDITYSRVPTYHAFLIFVRIYI